MANLTDDQALLKLREDANAALQQLRSLKTQKTASLAAVEAIKDPLAADITIAQWAGWSMTEAMTAIGLTKQDFRDAVMYLDIVQDCNSKIPVLEAYLTSVKDNLQNAEYTTEIETELGI